MHNRPECAPKRDSEVRQEIEKLEKVVEAISQSIASMRTKFEPVLRTPGPCGISANKETENLVPLATSIRQSSRRLEGCQDDMQQIIRDCEL